MVWYKEENKIGNLMGLPYPYELSIRAMAALEAAMSISKVARLFKISRDTLHSGKL